VGAQHHRLLRFGAEFLHDAPPQQARRAQLGHFHVEVHADAEEERQPAGEIVDVHAFGDGGAHVFHAVGQGQRQFQRRRGARFLHVVAGDRDRVELRHMLGGVGDDVGDDAHRRFGRIDVGVAHHEFFEDVVLDGARQLLAADARLLGRDDVAGQYRQHRAVHRHRNRDLVERDAVEKDFHVLDRVDRDAGLADVAGHARMIGIVAAMGGQVERHRDALAAAGQRAAIEGVGIGGGGEAGVLTDCPWPRRVHRRLRAAHERLESGQRVGMGQALHVGGGVQRLERDAVGLRRVEPRGIAAGRGAGRRLAPVLQRGWSCYGHGAWFGHVGGFLQADGLRRLYPVAAGFPMGCCLAAHIA
jgi:hypothetical protein